MATMENQERDPTRAEGETQQTTGQVDLSERSRRATRKVLRWLPWALMNLVVVGTSIVVGSIAVTGTAVALAIFSPVLIPAGILLFLTVGGVLATIAVGVAVFTAGSRLYKHLKASHASANSVANKDEKPSTTEEPRDYRQAVLVASSA